MRALHVLILLTPLLAGCASSSSPANAEVGEGGGDRQASPSETPRREAGEDASKEPLTARPYTKRAGGRAEPESAELERRFLAPAPPPQAKDPLAGWPKRATHWEWKPGRLALSVVDDGRFVRRPLELLALERSLAREPGLRGVVALALPKRGELELEALFKAANRQGHRLLLLELSPGRRGRPEALLFGLPQGALLAEVPLDRALEASAADPQPWATREDVVGRVARAYRSSCLRLRRAEK